MLAQLKCVRSLDHGQAILSPYRSRATVGYTNCITSQESIDSILRNNRKVICFGVANATVDPH